MPAPAAILDLVARSCRIRWCQCCPAILVENLNQHGLHYLLGVLNSSVLSHYLRQVCPPKLGGLVKFSATCLSDAPIRVIDPKNKADQAAHDRIVKLVEQMLKLHQDRAAAKTPHEQTALDRQITATDQQIDQEVYALYGLTAEEIALVEGHAMPRDETASPSKEPESVSVWHATLEYPHKTGCKGHMVFREEPGEYRAKPS